MHAPCEAGEKLEIISKVYLSLLMMGVQPFPFLCKIILYFPMQKGLFSMREPSEFEILA